MPEVLWLIVGLAAGAGAAWFLVAARARAVGLAQASDAEARLGAAEGRLLELRARVEVQDRDLLELRGALDGERQTRVRAETQLEEEKRNVAEQRKLVEDARQNLSETFKALSSDALKGNSQAFLELAKQSLATVVADAKGDLGKRKEAIDGLVKPLGESLHRYQSLLRDVETKREKAYGGLREQIDSLIHTQRQLEKETGDLVSALRRPQVRGRWGEMTLRRVVELAGMSDRCDFSEQVSVESDSGRLRPDMIVHLPGDREIVVDSKVSLDAYLNAISADTEDQRTQQLTRHAAQIRQHMEQLATKSYWEQFQRAPDLVVMFIPGESFFGTALEYDRRLLEDGMAKRVVLATPTTLIALLRAVAYGWRQEQIAKNAQAISELGKDLYDRLRTLSQHLVAMGRGLARANEAYNKAVGSMETRVFPAGRRFKELGVSVGPDIPEVAPLDVVPRVLNAPELVDEGAPEAET